MSSADCLRIMTSVRLDGRVAVITGASRGLGPEARPQHPAGQPPVAELAPLR